MEHNLTQPVTQSHFSNACLEGDHSPSTLTDLVSLRSFSKELPSALPASPTSAMVGASGGYYTMLDRVGDCERCSVIDD